MKTNILIIICSFMASSVYAHSKSCPEAGLSDEQKAQKEALREDFKASVEEGLSKEERRAKWAEFHQQVLDTIAETDEQRAALEQCFEERKERWKKRRRGCPEAGLSDEQKDAWKALRKDFRASVEGLSREEKREKKAEFHQQVLDTIPATEEQAEALSQCFEERKKRGKKKRRGCPEADLSDEQKDEWKALRKDFRASVEGLSHEEKQEKRAEFHQQVLDTIAETDEQREALSQCFEKRKKRGKKKRGKKKHE